MKQFFRSVSLVEILGFHMGIPGRRSLPSEAFPSEILLQVHSNMILI
jgi:hypothetical protein